MEPGRNLKKEEQHETGKKGIGGNSVYMYAAEPASCGCFCRGGSGSGHAGGSGTADDGGKDTGRNVCGRAGWRDPEAGTGRDGYGAGGCRL